jgi:hypothetical protein
VSSSERCWESARNPKPAPQGFYGVASGTLSMPASKIQQGASIRKLWLLNRYTGFYCWKLCGHCSGGIDVVGWDVGELLPSLSVCEQ